MKLNSTTRILLLLILVSWGSVLSAQTTGDYRSKATGSWSNLNSWQRFDGSAWQDIFLLSELPNASNAGVVTILNGHTITQDIAANSIDQVVIDNGGSLLLDVSTEISDGTGTDLTVNGQLVLNTSSACLCSSNGNAGINVAGLITWTSGNIQLGTLTITSAGTLELTAANNRALSGTTVNNAGTINWTAGNLDVSALASFSNTGTITATLTGTTTLNINSPTTFSNAGTLEFSNNQSLPGFFSITNTSTGHVQLDGAGFITHAAAYSNQGVTTILNGKQFSVTGNVDNPGILRGTGSLVIGGTFTNSGSIRPGLSPGIIGIDGDYSGGALDIELVDNSGAGTGFDQVNVTGTVDISTITLNLGDFGTQLGDYVIMSATGGITGTSFANALPPNFSLAVVGNQVILTKTSFPLPLTWISFSGKVNNDKVALEWITANETNTSHFNIERSIDGRAFTQIGELISNGSSTGNHTIYHFVDNSPLAASTNFYRILQVDIDGKRSYSPTIRMNTSNRNPFTVSISPNPTSAIMNLVIEGAQDRETLQFDLLSTNGMTIVSRQLVVSGNSMTIPVQRGAVNSGLYFYRVTRKHNNETFTGKIVLQ